MMMNAFAHLSVLPAGNVIRNGMPSGTTSSAHVLAESLTDSVVLEITEVKATNIGTKSATVTWTTNELSDSQVEFGFTNTYGQATVLDTEHVEKHTVHLKGLRDGANYHYRVISSHENNPSVVSEDFTFLTLTAGQPLRNGPPTAVIEVVGKKLEKNRISVDPGESVQFIGSKSTDPEGDELRFYWSFGDGAVSNEPDPLHMYHQSGLFTVSLVVDDEQWPLYKTNPYVIPFRQNPLTRRGGIIVADLDGDRLLDYLVSQKDDPLESQDRPATIGAYAHEGSLLWLQRVDLRINEITYGLPGLFGPGLAAADVDQDGQTEVLYLDTGNALIIRNGLTGQIEHTLVLPTPPGGIGRWGQLQVCNLRGLGDRDVILQADHDPMNFDERNIAPWLTAITVPEGKVLWTTDLYYGPRHGGFRAADLDGDGLDEVAGAVLIDHDGTQMNSWSYHHIAGHLDGVFMDDIRKEAAGLEVVVPEESHRGDDKAGIVGIDRVFVYASRDGDEPQNLAVGDFDPSRPGEEIWCRSRYDTDQQPWVLDADGNVIAEWSLNEKKPFNWSDQGIEMISAIDWFGGYKKYIAAKERHSEGRIAIIDPMTGEFVRWWEEEAARIYVADVAGDPREEIIVINNQKREIRIYWNDALNLNSPKERLWHQNQYKRQKQNYNYYSP